MWVCVVGFVWVVCVWFAVCLCGWSVGGGGCGCVGVVVRVCESCVISIFKWCLWLIVLCGTRCEVERLAGAAHLPIDNASRWLELVQKSQWDRKRECLLEIFLH